MKNRIPFTARSVSCITMLLSLMFSWPGLADQQSYQKPPQAILQVLNTTSPLSAFVSPTHDTLLIADLLLYPPISELAQPMLRLAGARINPNNNAPIRGEGWSYSYHYIKYSLRDIPTGRETLVTLPPGARASAPRWAADGKRYAFSNTTAKGVELWIGQPDGTVRQLKGVQLNPVLGSDFQWMPDQKTLLVKLIPPGRAAAPLESTAPPGPNIQESIGAGGPSSTYEVRDVLKSPHDADLFDYYAASQLALVDTATGRITPANKPALYVVLSPAPSGEYLLVSHIHRPYSYLHPFERFPVTVEVWNRKGERVYTVAELPLADQVPVQGVRTGPRDFEWRPTQPATLIWAEALDGGDSKKKVPYHDSFHMVSAPFTAAPREWFRTEQRSAVGGWGERDGLVLISDFDFDRRWLRTFAVNADDPAAKPQLLWELNSMDRYKNPGSPVLRVLPTGHRVIQQDADGIYLSGLGASPEGDRPFLDVFHLSNRTTNRLFRSDASCYEVFLSWIDSAHGKFLTRHESPSDPPNFFVRTLAGFPAGSANGAKPGEPIVTSTSSALTAFKDPTPQLSGITKRLVKYQRPDGVQLSFTLYLPPGYQEGTRLPTVLWAYPLDYTDPNVAGEVAGSTQRFTTILGASQLFFLLDGYAVIDNPTMAVIGNPDSWYDTFIPQIVANAKAAIDKAVELGVADPERVGVMGHSHGALMTANLLAHSDLFRAGIARSGAYNHTLRPFGFQQERRTLWEAEQTYLKLSPLMYANKIKTPLLLIHGEADVNPGTVPLQSERFYEAIRGTGGTVRLVMLPFESHGYTARESVEHTIYEMLSWFDRYVKNAAPRKTTSMRQP